MNLTTTHLIELIRDIPLNVPYTYVNTKSGSTAELIAINPAETSVTIKRVTKDGTIKITRVDSKKISAIADGLQENVPISIDDLLRNNDNVRSAIEAILVRTSEIYTYFVKNHKTLVWVPTRIHKAGNITVLPPEDYNILRSNTVKSLDDKSLNRALLAMEKQILATQELVSIQKRLMESIRLCPSGINTDKIQKTLNDQMSKINDMLERQESIKLILTR